MRYVGNNMLLVADPEDGQSVHQSVKQTDRQTSGRGWQTRGNAVGCCPYGREGSGQRGLAGWRAGKLVGWLISWLDIA